MKNLESVDKEVADLIKKEENRQKENIDLIPSENHTSKAVREALGSVLTDKYSEGYPQKRYYQGHKYIDQIEIAAQERAKKLFGVPYANVQPYSGSPANLAIYLATCTPQRDKIMGLALAFGGHLTHGQPQSATGQFFKSVLYELDKSARLDFDEIEKLAKREKPKIIVCGYTAYPRTIDFKRFGQIADSVRAYLLADISHITGLVIAGVHPSPAPYADIIMTTTHKTLRGPRGAIIMVTEKGLKKDPDLGKKIDTAIIPGLQGGPHDHQTAAIAVALKEAATASFRRYGVQIVSNSKALASALTRFDFDLVSGGSDNHLILIDLQNKGVNGSIAALALEAAGIIVNKNAVPFDPMPPFYPSGIRIGTPAVTTRGMKEREMKKLAFWINRVIEEVKKEKLPIDKKERSEFMRDFKDRSARNKKLLLIAKEIRALTAKFPIP